MIVDKDYCCSSYLVFREVVGDRMFHKDAIIKRQSKYGHDSKRFTISTSHEVERHIEDTLAKNKDKKMALLLSGGMDSGLLASFMQGYDAYTFRFLNGEFAKEELKRAEKFAAINHMNLHYVDIEWGRIEHCIDELMINKGSPIHSIEPQIYLSATQALKNNVELMVIGDGADFAFGGLDQLVSKDWNYDEFVSRYTYLNPSLVLKNPVKMDKVFQQYRLPNDKIDYKTIVFDTLAPNESYESYANAFNTASLDYIDPYADLYLDKIDLDRIRSGESKYIIRELFKRRYGFEAPEKIPMPRPVDFYFEEWEGPRRTEFKENLDMKDFTGNQKWQMWCLERFLELYYRFL